MRIRSRLFTKLLAITAVVLLRALFLTCRKRTRAEAGGIDPYQGTGARRYLYCVWHDQIATTVFFGRPKHSAGLVSRHQDGSYLADAMQIAGIVPIRGSSKRGGAQAVRQMLEAARELHIVITPDGPRGPRRQLKDGIVFLASHSGRSIIPAAYACRNGWRIRGNWTDLLLPKPFTTVFVIGGAPFEVPPDLSREQIAAHTARLQSEMDRLQAAVDAWAAGDETMHAAPRRHAATPAETRRDARAA
jgi:lysophospholipid acyltransferase (LPLAT)-like uncharacterized protein